jgi:hypothetical protein
MVSPAAGGDRAVGRSPLRLGVPGPTVAPRSTVTSLVTAVPRMVVTRQAVAPRLSLIHSGGDPARSAAPPPRKLSLLRGRARRSTSS